MSLGLQRRIHGGNDAFLSDKEEPIWRRGGRKAFPAEDPWPQERSHLGMFKEQKDQYNWNKV